MTWKLWGPATYSRKCETLLRWVPGENLSFGLLPSYTGLIYEDRLQRIPMTMPDVNTQGGNHDRLRGLGWIAEAFTIDDRVHKIGIYCRL